MTSELRFEILRGADVAGRLDTLAGLRIAVFRDWPYLYEGTPDYERRYLQTYVDCPDSLAVLVWDGDRAIGATTSLPMTAAETEMQAPFRRQGYEIGTVHYFGESVVLGGYRGRGIGVRFFAERETHAARLGSRWCAFCSVERPADHPARPAGYVPNDAFWGRRGYTRHLELSTAYSWPDIGQRESTSKPMVFWLRELPAS